MSHAKTRRYDEIGVSRVCAQRRFEVPLVALGAGVAEDRQLGIDQGGKSDERQIEGTRSQGFEAIRDPQVANKKKGRSLLESRPPSSRVKR